MMMMYLPLNSRASRWRRRRRRRRGRRTSAFKDCTQLSNRHVRLHTERLHPVLSVPLRQQTVRLMVQVNADNPAHQEAVKRSRPYTLWHRNLKILLIDVHRLLEGIAMAQSSGGVTNFRHLL